MKTPFVYTPGPTEVRENVRLSRARETTNPDLDLEFYDFYKDTCDKIGQLLNTKNPVRILSGEGILGLEAACASLTEKGDRVLVIDNGIFGEGFGDFVTLYGGEVVFYRGNRKAEIDVEDLKKFLEQQQGDFKYATLVHCDTPSGVLNNIREICPLLKSKGIITVVDAVASLAGEEIRVDDWGIDILLGASQKAVSAPPGLTFLSISKEAFRAMEERRTPIASYYCNLLVWKDYYENKWFPYTMPISDIVGLRTAIDNILKEGPAEMINRHRAIAKATREALREAGLKLYIEKGHASTVTVFELPEGIQEEELKNYLLNRFNILIAGSFGYLKGKVIRIGHMGENARTYKVAYILDSLEKTLEALGYNLKMSLTQTFNRQLNR